MDYLPEDDSIKKFRGSWLIAKEDKSILPGVFAAGDVIKPGRLTDAIGDGIKAAHYADEYVMGQAMTPFPEKHKIPAERLSKAYLPSAIIAIWVSLAQELCSVALAVVLVVTANVFGVLPRGGYYSCTA